MKRKLKDIFIIIILLMIAFLICMKSPVNILTKSMEDSTDSGVFKYIGWSMTQEKVPYLELFDHKGLLLYFINYIGTMISPINGVWLIEFTLMFISLFFTYKLARKFTSKIVALLVTIIVFAPMYDYFDKGNLTEEYALPFQIIALNIFFDFFLNPNKYSGLERKNSLLRMDFKWFNIPVSICGICFACVLFLRANMISVWFIFCIMVFIYCIANKKYHELIKFTISFVSGILIVTIPMIIYLICNDAWQSFINDYILFNIKYSDNTGRISKLNVFIKFCSATTTMLAFVIITIKLYIQIKNKDKWYFNFGYLIYMLTTILFASMSGKYYGHYGMMILPALIYPYCIMYKFLSTTKEKWNGLKLVVTSYLLITLVVPVYLNFTKDFLNTMYYKGKPIYTNKIIEYIKENTEEDDLISVFGNRDSIYYLTNRQSASKYSYQSPIATIDKNIMEEYFRDLEEKKPIVIVYALINRDDTRNKEIIQRMNEFLRKHNYQLVEKIEGMELYEIIER